MTQPETGADAPDTQDPDADPGMKASGTAQPDQAEGEDDTAETGGATT